jgi:hypothetical protein
MKSNGNKALRQLITLDDKKMSQYGFKAADCIQDYFTALKLVQDVYIEEGYVNAHEVSSPCRILENHFFDKTAVFIGKKNEKLIFTVSLFPDSPYGLPMDAIFGKELDLLRAQGRKIGEVGCLATHPDVRDGSQNMLMQGNKILFKYAKEHLQLDDLVITVNPKHAPVYKQLLLFNDLANGQVKTYPKVNRNPAVALILNLREVEKKFQQCYGNNAPETNLHHFLFVKKSPMLQLPANNNLVANPFVRCFTPSLRTSQQRPISIQPDVLGEYTIPQRSVLHHHRPSFHTNSDNSLDMGWLSETIFQRNFMSQP